MSDVLLLFEDTSPTCRHCGTPFSRRGAKPARFCSPRCYDAYRAATSQGTRPCIAPGCPRMGHKRGLCVRHYAYHHKHGYYEPRHEEPPALALAPTDAAWIAGIVDGEGHLGIGRTKCCKNQEAYWHYSARCTVYNNSLAMLDRLRALTGCGRITARRVRNPRWRQRFEWTIDRRNDIPRFLLAISPYLVVKREQAELLLQFPVRYSKASDDRERLYLAIGKLNQAPPP